MKYLILLIPSLALATVKPEVPAPTQTQAQQQHQEQIQETTQTATQNNNQAQGNQQSVSFERSAPSLAQGSLMIGNCGAGVNGGASNSGGAGFLGATWTPKDCKLLLAAQSFMAMGMPDEACRMVTGIKAVQARYKALNIAIPDCKPRAVEPAKQLFCAPQPPMSVCYSKQDMDHRDRKIIEAVDQKRSK